MRVHGDYLCEIAEIQVCPVVAGGDDGDDEEDEEDDEDEEEEDEEEDEEAVWT